LARSSSSKSAGRRSGATAQPGRSGRTIFFPARHKQLARIITIRSPQEARESVRKLDEWADDEADRVRTAIRAATLAANRALVSTRRKTRPLSPQERKEMLQVAEIYRSHTRRLSKKLEDLEQSSPKSGRGGRSRSSAHSSSQLGQPIA